MYFPTVYMTAYVHMIYCSLVDPSIFPYNEINSIFNDFMNTFVTESILLKFITLTLTYIAINIAIMKHGKFTYCIM